MNEAALLAARRDASAVHMHDFDEAIDRLIAGLEKKRVMSQKEREIVAYHESGHAIVASVLPGMDPVHKISIVQRGFGALGYTMQLPLEDRYLMQKGDLLNQLAVLLGGRVAEEIAIGEISTGASNDLQRVTDLARSMVTEWGMSERLGTINFDVNRRGRFIDIGGPPERGLYSEDTARLIDDEVKQIIMAAHNDARRILRDRRDLLKTVAAPPLGERSDGGRRTARDHRQPARSAAEFGEPGLKRSRFTIVSGRGRPWPNCFIRLHARWRQHPAVRAGRVAAADSSRHSVWRCCALAPWKSAIVGGEPPRSCWRGWSGACRFRSPSRL